MSLCPTSVIMRVDAPYVSPRHLIHACDVVWDAAEKGKITPELIALARGPREPADNEVILDWLNEHGFDVDAHMHIDDAVYIVGRMTMHSLASVIVEVVIARAANVQGVDERGEPVSNSQGILGFTTPRSQQLDMSKYAAWHASPHRTAQFNAPIVLRGLAEETALAEVEAYAATDRLQWQHIVNDRTKRCPKCGLITEGGPDTRDGSLFCWCPEDESGENTPC